MAATSLNLDSPPRRSSPPQIKDVSSVTLSWSVRTGGFLPGHSFAQVDWICQAGSTIVYVNEWFGSGPAGKAGIRASSRMFKFRIRGMNDPVITIVCRRFFKYNSGNHAW